MANGSVQFRVGAPFLAAANSSGDEATATTTATATATTLLACESNVSEAWKLWDPVCSTRYDSLTSLVVVSVILVFITLWTVVGNLLVLLALYRFKSLRTMNNILIGNLAISDLLLAATVLPLSIANDVLGYWVFGEVACVAWLSLDVLYCTASIWGLLTIAFDRYTATAYPLWYHENRSPKRALIYVLFVWIFSVIISFAPFIGWREMMANSLKYDSGLNRYECMLFINKSYVVYSGTGSFILPLTLMVFLYMRIFIALHQRAKRSRAKAKAYLASGKRLSRINGCHHQMEETTAFATTVMRDTTGETLATASTYTSLLAANNGLHSPKGLGELSEHTEAEDCDDDEEEREKASESDSEGLEPDDDKEVRRINYSMKRKDASVQKSDPKEMLPFSESTESKQGLLSSPNPTDEGSSNHPDETARGQRNGKSSEDTLGLSPAETSPQGSGNLSDEQDSGKQAKQSESETLRRSCRLTSSMKRRFELREQRATKRMVLILACFMVCWIPFLFMYMIRSFCEHCPMDIHGIIIIIWLGYANSSLNPIMYTIFNTDFRRAFIKILHVKVRKKGSRTL